MKKIFYLLIFLFFANTIEAQVGINTTNPDAQLDIRSSNQATPTNTDGILIPKVDAFPATNPTAAQQGMLVYLTTTSGTDLPGFYYWDNVTVDWKPIIGNSVGTLDQAYDFGGAGNGRTITADAGAVIINGTDGLVSTGTDGSGAVAPSGGGAKMIWNPRKSAFRAGRVTTNQWDDVNIGSYSVAFGDRSIASGSYSSAFGLLSIASGPNATAFGLGTSSASGSTFAAGFNTDADGYLSTVFGDSNAASSYGETVFGIGATTYTPSVNGALNFRAANATDRLFVIGNAIDANSNGFVENPERSDAIIVLKNGLTRLPSTTNAMITAADGKAVVTKEYLQSSTSGTLDQAYDFGGAGNGRTITADTGPVLISGTDGLVSTGTFGTGALAPIGAGDRMVWNPRKGAFRAGNAAGNEWDDANLGQYSAAFGANPTASGTYSFAIGIGNTASGIGSFSAGFNALASGDMSTTFGYETVASGEGAVAFGNSTDATGFYSTAFGFGTTASGVNSAAFGVNSVASGQNSIAFGQSAIASGQSSTAFGQSTSASGLYATVFGQSNGASGNISTAFGLGNSASGTLSTVFGDFNSSSGNFSTSFGSSNNATGMYSTVFGQGNESFGEVSTAFGQGTVAIGENSLVAGRNNQAVSFAETVIGIGATFYSPSLNGNTQFRAANATDRLFVIGNAIDANNNDLVDFAERRDAMVVLKNGNTGLGTSTPLNRLHVVGNIRMVDGNQAAGRVLTSDVNGVATWQNASANAWGLLGNAGTNATTNFLGTTDNIDLVFRRGNIISGRLGDSNTFFGRNSGVVNTGTSNTFIGERAGIANASGSSNTFLGRLAGANGASGNDNTYLGYASGLNNTGNSNLMLGSFASQNTSGSFNVFLGSSAGSNNTTGSRNTTIGFQSDVGAGNLTNATAIGNLAQVDASNSLVLGSINGVNGSLVSTNVGIGTTSPLTRLDVVDENTTTTNLTYGNLHVRSNNAQNIDVGGAITLGGYNDDTMLQPRVFGSVEGRKSNATTNSSSGYLIFKTNNAGTLAERMRITNTGNIGIGTTVPGGLFELALDQGRKPGTNTWTIVSDQRLKTINGTYTKGLNEILQLNPIRFNYKNIGERTFDKEVLDTEYPGFIAQEVQPLFPDAVGTDADGFLNFNIHPILIASVNAIKELNAQNESLQTENESLKTELNKQKALLESVLQRLTLLEQK
ncbi:tail fiber domain-containing protein [Flavobacterium sp.]|uniref:tail fiber domain-containing protein n=1 Tax=Flavobacterium sp. TaxID=239 RepID=UPI002B4AE785|nr:tail fiber domain-containing protein [Flavobacterium sp.]HLP64270.1 tail fiber domain-containing protein [Flavobacterium sp.]